MSRPSAPSMPTKTQIEAVHAIVLKISPGARISRVGPDGVFFDYPGDKSSDQGDGGNWSGKPFAAE
ncbi:hypothetical protein [Mangrovicoccus sp. HB161399]|uniref:hypothetical protein n=1 Tax=Mangrovicoccus sp. HB161399 TaxID=2720392 RepID=UPI0015577C7E|nr:hypothetical protein [Mangrovicoccus sp. HB161399]